MTSSVQFGQNPSHPWAMSACLCFVEQARLSKMCLSSEIEMVIMERCKLISATEQNITDEEKSAAASEMSSWNR